MSWYIMSLFRQETKDAFKHKRDRCKARDAANGYSIRKSRNVEDALLCSNPPGRPCIARMALLLAARLDDQTARFPPGPASNAWPAHIRFLLKQALSIFRQSHSDA